MFHLDFYGCSKHGDLVSHSRWHEENLEDRALTFAESLEHLPYRKSRELSLVLRIIFDEFERAQEGKQRTGRIHKVILFGSYARGDWVEDQLSGYRSDYDLLIVVDIERWSEQNEVWHQVSEHFVRELTITKRLETPVNFIVHSLQDVNDKLARGKPFFIDIATDGVMLYETTGHPLAKPKPLDSKAARDEASGHFEQWRVKANQFILTAELQREREWFALATFNLHQAGEALYHCTLLVYTLYSPKSHRLKVLRSSAERVEPRLIAAWPRDTKFARRCFERLDRAYVDARYSSHFPITDDELSFIFTRVKALQKIVHDVCVGHLNSFGS